MTFSEYLVSKKIDEAAFSKAEPSLFENWQKEFEQVHASSFTAQKLYLINPVRRKYTLVVAEPEKVKAAALPVKPAVEISAPKAPTAVTTVSDQANPPEITAEDKASDIETKAAPAKPARPVFKPKPKLS